MVKRESLIRDEVKIFDKIIRIYSFFFFYNLGVYKEIVNCWRFLGLNFVSEMRRFFIGGFLELEDSIYIVIFFIFDVSLYNLL